MGKSNLKANIAAFSVIWVLLAVLTVNDVNAQVAEKFKFWKQDTGLKSEGIFLMPLVYYTPDTRLAAGAVGIYYFNMGTHTKAEDENTRLSYVKLLSDYTQNKQFDLWSSWNVFTDDEEFLFKGEFRFRNFPDRYYGVGNNTTEDQLEMYSYDLFNFKALALKKLGKGLFAGGDYQFSHEYNFDLEEGGELIRGNVTGYRGGTGSALGAVLVYDTRDNIMNPYEGIFIEGSSYFYNEAFGGNFNFINLNLAFAKYFELKDHHILGFHAVARSNFGGVPFLDMAKVGGEEILRGYAANRFRDHHFFGVQTEYRFPVWWRFGMTVFAGVGDVMRTPQDFRLDRLKYSLGAGIRFSINDRERLNLRFDYGVGRNNDAFYIMMGEAF